MEDLSCALLESHLMKARMLLRFFACLVAGRVVTAKSVRELMHTIVEAALHLAKSTNDASGRSWQPYTDFIVYTVLIALPWGSTVIFEDAPAAWEALCTKVDDYISNRPIQRDSATSPFLAPPKENDVPAQYDRRVIFPVSVFVTGVIVAVRVF